MEVILLYLPNFLLVFCRITAFFVVAPIFSFYQMPSSFKIGFSFFVSWICFFFIGLGSPVPIDGLYLLTVIKEVLIGVLLGFIAYLFFAAVQIAGSFVDLQTGLGIANVIDPMTGTQSPILGNFKYIVAILLFLTFNGHHVLIKAIIDSYEWVPVSNALFARMYEGDISTFLTQTFATMFALALQMSAPIVATLFLADIALGLLARTAPQFNIFVVGLPVKIILGFVVLVLVLPSFISLFEQLFSRMFEAIYQLIDIMAVRN